MEKLELDLIRQAELNLTIRSQNSAGVAFSSAVGGKKPQDGLPADVPAETEHRTDGALVKGFYSRFLI